MTSELRPAVEVASAVYDECREKGIRDGGALIKADREAVRAEQAAELAKWKALAETLAGAAEALMPTHVNLRMPHPSDDYVLPLDVSMGELRALDQALTSYKEQRHD